MNQDINLRIRHIPNCFMLQKPEFIDIFVLFTTATIVINELLLCPVFLFSWFITNVSNRYNGKKSYPLDPMHVEVISLTFKVSHVQPGVIAV